MPYIFIRKEKMDKKGITAHMTVRNEDRFIWYAVSSVLPYVKQLIIFDTGSTDNTVLIIRSINNKKIIFQEKGEVNAHELVNLRQQQIEMTKTNWIWIVDGDEIYPQKAVRKVVKLTENKSLYGIIVNRHDLLGDIYHFQDEKVGAYNQFGKLGHYVLRLINKEAVEGLQVLGKYPDEYFADAKGKSIKSYGKNRFAFVEEKIFHAMYLKRSSKGGNLSEIANRQKWKIELGREINKSLLPEVFFQKRPEFVSEVTQKISWRYKMLALVITPVKKLKRIILN